MYEADDRDRVLELSGVPQSSTGAPIPCVLADEHRVVLAYYVERSDPEWDGSAVRVVAPVGSDEAIAIVRLNGCHAHMFGSPNDEAFMGHPLASRGLHPYGAFKVENSSWVRKLERMNSVHRFHKPEQFWKLQHLVFAFHDSTFECICQGFDLTRMQGSISDAIPTMVGLLEWHGPILR